MTAMELLWTVLLSFTPTLELRASIPYAVFGAGWDPWVAGAVGTLANALLAPLLWIFLHKGLHVFLRWPWFARVWEGYARKKQAALQKTVDRYGVLGLAVFIGVPLPGTGVYSGAVAAMLVGYRTRDFLLASTLGCLIAGAAVTAVVASGSEAFSFFYKH